MKKRCLLFIAFLASVLVLPFAFASHLDDIGLRARELSISLSMDSTLQVLRVAHSPMVLDLEWKIYYNPVDTWQQGVLSKEVSPTSVDPDGLLFRWSSPNEGIYNFSLKSDVLVRNDLIQVKDKLEFPITTIDASAEQYLLPSGNIDFQDPAIIEKASELSQGQTDLNQVVFRLFTWVADNIEYRRTDFTKGTAQSASWVMENGYGVCDEITNLFIAFARSMGIPARYISGIAYTNVDGLDTWEPHAWAELYFPGYGWIPFDPTYREYGYVDPTHVVLMYGIDSNQSTGTAKWIGRDAQVIQSPLDIQASLNQRFGTADDQVELTLDPLKQNLGFGSYTLIRADAKNPHDYYVYTDLNLVKATYFTTEDKLRQGILLGPNEETSVYWLIKIEEDLNPKYYYTLPIMVLTTRDSNSTTELFAKAGNHYYSKEDMEQLLPEIDPEAQYTYTRKIDISCRPEKREIYTYEPQMITCILHNIGNIPLAEVDICMDKDCETIGLQIAQSISLNFTIPPSKQGVYEKSIKVTGQDLYKTAAVRYTVMDEPLLTIAELEYPSDIKYEELYKISCIIRHDSDSAAHNVTLTFTNRQSESFNFTSLSADQPIFLYFQGKNMRYGENPVRISLQYYDQNGKKYASTQEIMIRFGGANFAERINLFLTDIALWLWKVFQI